MLFADTWPGVLIRSAAAARCAARPWSRPARPVSEPETSVSSRFRLTPTSTGQPSSRIVSRRASSRHDWAGSFEKPMPESTMMRRGSVPAPTAISTRFRSSAATSRARSAYVSDRCSGISLERPVCEDVGSAQLGHHREHRRIGEPATDVVDHTGAGVRGTARDFRPHRVDRHAHTQPGKRPDDRENALQLGGQRHTPGPWPRRFAADVDPIRPGRGQRPGLPHRRGDVGVSPAVGERIGGHMEDPHDAGALRPRAGDDERRGSPGGHLRTTVLWPCTSTRFSK